LDNSISNKSKRGTTNRTKNVGDTVIKQHIIEVEEMRELFVKGLSVSPKAGLKSFFTLALSAKYKRYDHKTCDIIIPKLSLIDLRSLVKSPIEKEWSNSVFGRYGSKIRPDVLRYIKRNSKEIADKLLSFKNYN